MKECPFCAEEIQDEALKCKHCGSDLAGKSPAGRHRSRFIVWAIAITVMMVAALFFGAFLLNKIQKKAEAVKGVVQRVRQIEGRKGPEAESYQSNIEITLKPEVKAHDEQTKTSRVLIRGEVKNKGPRQVLFLKVGFTFLDEKGQSVFYEDDLLAHQLPIGSNNTPVPAQGQKEFLCEWLVPDTWDGKTIKTEILEIGL